MTNRGIAQVLLDNLRPAILKLSHDSSRKAMVQVMKLQVARNVALRSLGFMEGKKGRVVKFKPAKLNTPKPKRERLNRVIALRFSDDTVPSTDNSIGGPNDYAYQM